MTVRELMQALDDLRESEDYDPDWEVVLQADPEGNEYHGLRIVDSDCLVAEGHHGAVGPYLDVYSLDWDADEAAWACGHSMEEDEWEAMKARLPRAVVLSP